VSGVSFTISLIYVLAAACFVIGLHLMNSPATARRGNQISAGGMGVAVIATVVLLAQHHVGTANWVVMGLAGAAGAAAGAVEARVVKMTAMPQLVSLFNAVGGGAAALLAVSDILRKRPDHLGNLASITGALDMVIGLVTFTGSLVAAGKLQGWIPGQPLVFRGSRLLNALLALAFVTGGVWLVASSGGTAALALVLGAAGVFGVTMVMPIGGADMPVVISLLNAFTGTAVAMAGFVIGNTTLIIAGALVGAAGSILTKLMADAMNRSLVSIIVGGFGTGDQKTAVAPGAAVAASVRQVSADDAAIQLGYASKIIIVPGYGLAAAQAQHELSELAGYLEAHGADVSYAIHPVAGRMPGHMNVLLAEANVPYTQLKEMDDVNPQFSQADVALVVGANDVTNPAARRPGNPLSGMPILDVDHAKSIIVIKRSLGHGYAGVDNELYTDPKTAMFFADAKKGLAELLATVKTLVG
jgi:H+-translocating NAD(P) transhydrogenase subunit beta